MNKSFKSHWLDINFGYMFPDMSTIEQLSTLESTRKRGDRRTNRTRRALREALLELILEKGFEAVTVEDITDRADLGRTTFYLHYKDKEDLLLENARQLVDDLISRLSGVPLSAWNLGPHASHVELEAGNPILLTFQHIANNASLYRVILRGEGSYTSTRRLRQIIVEATHKIVQLISAKDELVFEPRMPLDMFLNYLAGAWIGIVYWWLENDLPCPAEEMARQFQQLFMCGAYEALGVNPAAKE
jgi:AcrR family transcriptional regulator